MAINKARALALVDEIVGDLQQPCSYKWLARQLDLPYDVCKQILFEYSAGKGNSVRTTFLLTGTTMSEAAGGRHAVRLVEGGVELDQVRRAFREITSMHVYSIGPRVDGPAGNGRGERESGGGGGSKLTAWAGKENGGHFLTSDPRNLAMANVDAIQAEELLKEGLRLDGVTIGEDAAAGRDSARAPLAPAPASPPPFDKPPGTLFDKASLRALRCGDAHHESTRGARVGPTDLDGKRRLVKAEPGPQGPPEGHSPPRGRNDALEARVKAEATGRPEGGGAQVSGESAASDEATAATAAPREEAKRPSKPAGKPTAKRPAAPRKPVAKPAESPRAKRRAILDSDEDEGEPEPTQLPAFEAPKEEPAEGPPEARGPGARPAAPGLGSSRAPGRPRKKARTFINDDGEEVTVEEEVDEEEEGEGGDGRLTCLRSVPPVTTPVPATTDTAEHTVAEPATTTGAAEPAPVPRTASGAKKGGTKQQRGIASFFGKKA